MLIPLKACAMEWGGSEYWRRVKTPVLFCSLWTKVHEILGRHRDPLYFSTPFSDCGYHVSFRRHSPLCLTVVQKPNKCKSFWPQCSGRTTTIFYSRLQCYFRNVNDTKTETITIRLRKRIVKWCQFAKRK